MSSSNKQYIFSFLWGFFFIGNLFKFPCAKGKQVAQSCFSPASHPEYRCNSFSGKIFCCGSVKTFLRCHLEFFLLWKWVQRRSEGSPALLNAREVWIQKFVFPWIQQSLARSHCWVWVQLHLAAEKTDPRPEVGGHRNVTKGGFRRYNRFHSPVYFWASRKKERSWQPVGERRASRDSSAKSFVFQRPVVVRYRSWSLELSLEQIQNSFADWKFKSRLFSLLHWEGAGRVLLPSLTSSSQRKAVSQWCWARGGTVTAVAAAVLVNAVLPLPSCRQGCSRDPDFPSLLLIQSLSFCLSYVLDS